MRNANSVCAPQVLISAWTWRGTGAPGIDRGGTDWHGCRCRSHTGRQTQPRQAHRKTPLRWAECAVIGFKPGGGGCTVVGYIGSVFCVIPQSRQMPRLPRALSAGPLRSGARNARSSDDRYAFDTTGMLTSLNSPRDDDLGRDDGPRSFVWSYRMAPEAVIQHNADVGPEIGNHLSCGHR